MSPIETRVASLSLLTLLPPVHVAVGGVDADSAPISELWKRECS